VRATKPITLATAKAVAAGNSCRQDDVIVAANVGRKAISDMLTTCKVKKKTLFLSNFKTCI
jgi:talin